MIDIRIGDCLSVMPSLPAQSIDTILTDPPYGLDFMGKSWDHGVPGVEFWQAALRVAKPGAILMAFGGTRTFHRLACAIEDAGWELRDTMCYLYGSGFPKSLDISKAIDKAAGEYIAGEETENTRHGIEGDDKNYNHSKVARASNPQSDAAHLWQGYGTALKPAWEPIIVAMKPLEGTYAENAQKWGVAGLNIDGGRIGTEPVPINHLEKWSGFGQEKRPDYTQEINSKGRWPANLLLDEESARLLDEQSGEIAAGYRVNPSTNKSTWFGAKDGSHIEGERGYADHGGASRFFYTAKASSSERNAGLEDMEAVKVETMNEYARPSEGRTADKNGGPKQNFHPTVKPVDLMRYLCKLTKTPTGGVVLDPFMGSGTTGIACILEHRDFIGIEIDQKYAEIAKKRIADMEGPLFTGGKYGE